MADPISKNLAGRIIDILGDGNIDDETRDRLKTFVEVIGKEIDEYTEDLLNDAATYETRGSVEEGSEDGDSGEEGSEEESSEEEGSEEEEEELTQEQKDENQRRDMKARRIGLASDTLLRLRRLKAPIRHNKWRQPTAGLTPENIRFVGFIAEGGFGAVFLIENTETGTQYAMKIQDIRDVEEDDNWSPIPVQDRGLSVSF